MTVWQIGYDNRYQTLAYVKPEDFRKALAFRYLGKPISDKWISYPVFITDEDGLEHGSDFINFQSLGALTCNKRVIDILRPILEPHVEVFPLDVPLDVPNEKYYALNVIEMVDCVDYQRTETKTLPGGKVSIVGLPRFRPNCHQDLPIFKIREWPASGIFVSDHFKLLVENNQLTGLIFKEIEE